LQEAKTTSFKILIIHDKLQIPFDSIYGLQANQHRYITEESITFGSSALAYENKEQSAMTKTTNTKLSLRFIKKHSVKAYEETGVQLHI
jgi:hypothetical protein